MKYLEAFLIAIFYGMGGHIGWQVIGAILSFMSGHVSNGG